jgi:hypothetical protein
MFVVHYCRSREGSFLMSGFDSIKVIRAFYFTSGRKEGAQERCTAAPRFFKEKKSPPLHRIRHYPLHHLLDRRLFPVFFGLS